MRPLSRSIGRRVACSVACAVSMVGAGCGADVAFERLDDVGFVDVGADVALDGSADTGDPDFVFGCSLLSPDRCELIGTTCCLPEVEVCVPSLGAPNRCMPAGASEAGDPCAAVNDCAPLHVCLAPDADADVQRCRRVCGSDLDCDEGACVAGAIPTVAGVGACLDAADPAAAPGEKRH